MPECILNVWLIVHAAMYRGWYTWFCDVPESCSAAGVFVLWGWGRNSATPKDNFQVWFLWTGRILKTFCCIEDSFSIVPVSSLGKSLQAGRETNCSRGYLEDWKWSHCSSSECNFGVNAVHEDDFWALFRKELAIPSCWLNCCAEGASSVTGRVGRS